jgi:uncharacterized protein (TIGR01777 family)
MSKIIIAGGTGFIGRLLETHLKSEGHEVLILTRNPRKENHVFWSPSEGEMDLEPLQGSSSLISLCGEGIAEKRWTDKRIQTLKDSRINPTNCITKNAKNISGLKQVIFISGIDCYPLDGSQPATETNDYGNHTVANIVRVWEESMEKSPENFKVLKLRLSMVLHDSKGALAKMLPIVRLGLASPLGKGKQAMNWIHWKDLMQTFSFSIEHRLEGIYNLNAGFENNKEFMRSLAMANNKGFWAPAVPSLILKLILGNLSSLLLKTRAAQSNKLRKAGFEFEFDNLDDCFKDLFQSK